MYRYDANRKEPSWLRTVFNRYIQLHIHAPAEKQNVLLEKDSNSLSVNLLLLLEPTSCLV